MFKKGKHVEKKDSHQQKSLLSRSLIQEQELGENMRRKKHRPERIKTLIDQEIRKMDRTGGAMSVRVGQEIREWLDDVTAPKEPAVNQDQLPSERALNHVVRPKEKRPRLSGVLFQGLEPIKVDPKVDPPQRSCFNCWESGHGSRKCPKSPTMDEYCANCGRRSVLVFGCPRCARAYRVVKWLRSISKFNKKFTKPQNEENWDQDVKVILYEENWNGEINQVEREDSYDEQAAFSPWEDESEQCPYEKNWDTELKAQATSKSNKKGENENNNNKNCRADLVKETSSNSNNATCETKNSKNTHSTGDRNDDPDAFVRRITLLTEQVERLNAYTATLPQDVRNDVFRYIFEVSKSS